MFFNLNLRQQNSFLGRTCCHLLLIMILCKIMFLHSKNGYSLIVAAQKGRLSMRSCFIAHPKANVVTSSSTCSQKNVLLPSRIGMMTISRRIGYDNAAPMNLLSDNHDISNHRRHYNHHIHNGLIGKKRTISSSTPLHISSSIVGNSGDTGQVNNNDNEDETMTTLIRNAYEENETDGIIEIAPILKTMECCTGDELIQSALDAVDNNKGKAAGILNAMIASCRHESNLNQKGKTDQATTVVGFDPDLAWEIYTTWEEQAEEIGLHLDLVTFCSTYSVMHDAATIDDNHGDTKDYYNDCAQHVLDRAERYSKKIAGSKRRRMLASLSRRKKENKNVQATNYIETLQDLYGPDFDILFENNDIIVVSKPSGMICYHTHKTTDGKIRKKKKKREKKKKKKKKDDKEDDDNTSNSDDEYNADISLEDALLDIGVQLSTLNPEALGIVHRIDRGTSGTLVLAKTNTAHAKLVTSFFTRSVNKSYTALVPFHGRRENDDEEGEKEGVGRTLEQSGLISNSIRGKSALSKYSIIETYETNAIHLKIETMTGRKHQVRIHCAEALGRPIFLDPMYSNDESNYDDTGNMDKVKNKIFDLMPQHKEGHQFFLHASSLAIDEFGFDVSSEQPQWWRNILSELKNM